MKHIKSQTTTKYDMFSYLPMNREVNSKHVESMVKSLNKMGCIRDVIVVTTNAFEGLTKTYVIDGQHLLNALIRQNAPVSYRSLKLNTVEEIVSCMAMLNNSSKSWGLLDYVNAYKVVNNDYMKLLKYINIYNLEPTMIAMIATNNTKSTCISKLIKEGSFSINNSKTEIMCKEFSDIFLKIGKADRWVKFNFLEVFLSVYGLYDHKKALVNLDKHLPTIKAMSDPHYATKYIREKIFN
jgi:hypothetical protein